MRALVIDDSKAMRIILRRMLTDLGFVVLEARHGLEALDRLGEEEIPDLALVDWNMPEMNGFDFVRAVRSNRGLDGIRLMMVTTEIEREHMVKALEAGADEYVMKPFTKEVIQEKLAILGLSQG